MRQAWDLSYLYLQSYLRRHLYAGTLLVGLILLALPSYVSAFSMGLDSFERVAKDFGITLISVYALVIVLLRLDHRCTRPTNEGPLSDSGSTGFSRSVPLGAPVGASPVPRGKLGRLVGGVDARFGLKDWAN